jgi:hypothetical protein
VLLDTLWGWPRHRLALHRQLQVLSNAGHQIHSKLNWAEPSHWDGSNTDPLDRAQFPLMAGRNIENYEEMLAASRLAVFASGFHWGWRNIMTLALMWGLPILADRPYLEPWFDLNRFLIQWNDDDDWAELATALADVSDKRRSATAMHNQRMFDELLAPERAADYFLTTSQA